MSEHGSYPIILIPDSIQAAKSKLPELAEFKLTLPNSPGPKPEILKKRTVATQGAIAVMPGAIAISYPKARIAGLGLMAAALIAIAVQTWRKIHQNHHRKTKYQRYHQEMAIYQEESRRHILEKQRAIVGFQLKLILQILDQSLPPDGSNSRARRGWSESTFQNYLERYFPGQIRTGETINRVGTNRYPYTPDFIFFDSHTGLHVDIEIDEPYAYLNRKPTHYIGCNKDGARNQVILSRGWLVVRFSEEQVVRWPESCCKNLAEAIAALMGNQITEAFVDVPDLPRRSRWTREEAIAMAERSSRQEYLKIV